MSEKDFPKRLLKYKGLGDQLKKYSRKELLALVCHLGKQANDSDAALKIILTEKHKANERIVNLENELAKTQSALDVECRISLRMEIRNLELLGHINNQPESSKNNGKQRRQ